MMSVLEERASDAAPTAALLLVDDVSNIAFVPAVHCLELQLPRLPRNDAELLSMITNHAPLMPGDLVWTLPTIDDAGNVRIVLTRRHWLVPFVEDLERARGRQLEVRTEIGGQRFLYSSTARSRQMAITRACCSLALVTVLIALFFVSRPDERSTTLDHLPISSVPAVDPAFSWPSVSATLAELTRGSIAKLGFAAIDRSRDGALMVQLATPDPDMLRAEIARSNMLPNYREAAQVRDDGGTYRVTYLREGGRIAMPQGTALPLRATDASAAASQTERSLYSRAADGVLQLTLMPPTAPNGQVLEFDLVFVGPQKDVLLAASQIESGPVPMRFAEWSLVPDAAGVRLSAVLVVPWAKLP